MTPELSRADDFLNMVDKEKGTVDRRIYSDQLIYQLELDRIFARAWNFMAHESMLSNPGDFFLTFIGEDRVIVVRDKDMQPQVLINSCRHRGNAVCRAEEGHATSFMCTYHGWTFDLKGNLVGVPGFKEVYHEDLKREEWGLIKAAEVDSYKGFIFATMDPQAPALEEYLGDVGRMGIDYMAARGNIAVVPGIQKYTIGCNWKLAADNVWDWYHVAISHASSGMARWNRRRTNQPQARDVNNLTRPHLVMLGEYGHVVAGPCAVDGVGALDGPPIEEQWRERPKAQEALGPLGLRTRGHPHIFPNLWINPHQISMRMPKGPLQTEIWWFTLIDQDLPQENFSSQLHSANHVFGPAGMLEQDDGENWDQSTRGTMGVVTKRYPFNYAMNLGRGEVLEDEAGPPHVDTNLNEHGALWLYRSWSEWMAAESWAELKANHSLPRGRV